VVRALFGIAASDNPTVATAIRSVGVRDFVIGRACSRPRVKETSTRCEAGLWRVPRAMPEIRYLSVLAFGVQVADPLGNGCLRFGLVGDVLQQALWLEAELLGHPHLGWREPTGARCFGPRLVLCCLARRGLAWSEG
jgi:hypothetical protein